MYPTATATVSLSRIVSEVLELVAVALGLVAVPLMIRQNELTFPFGIAYALLSVYVFNAAQLTASLLLHVYYVGVNAYGWWHWRNATDRERGVLPVTWTPGRLRVLLLVLTIAGFWVLTQVAERTSAASTFWDPAGTALSLTAMWMAARKHVENWLVWVVVNIIYVYVYAEQQLYWYVVLYGVYLVMAVIGWRTWRASMRAA